MSKMLPEPMCVEMLSSILRLKKAIFYEKVNFVHL